MSPKFGSKFSNYFAAQANCNFLIATERTSIGYSTTTNLGLALLNFKNIFGSKLQYIIWFLAVTDQKLLHGIPR